MNKTAFFISVALTTLALMIMGGVVYAMRSPQEPVTAENTEIENSPAATEMAPAAVESVFLEREAIYQQRIAEANARLEQLQQQLAAQAPAAKEADAQAPTITPEEAAQIAADYLGRTFESVFSVDIVAMNGENLYQVTFYSGDMVYVSLSGQIVGSAPAQVSSVSGGGGKGVKPAGGGQQGGQGGNHEDDDDHHDDDHGEDDD